MGGQADGSGKTHINLVNKKNCERLADETARDIEVANDGKAEARTGKPRRDCRRGQMVEICETRVRGEEKNEEAKEGRGRLSEGERMKPRPKRKRKKRTDPGHGKQGTAAEGMYVHTHTFSARASGGNAAQPGRRGRARMGGIKRTRGTARLLGRMVSSARSGATDVRPTVKADERTKKGASPQKKRPPKKDRGGGLQRRERTRHFFLGRGGGEGPGAADSDLARCHGGTFQYTKSYYPGA